MSPPTTFSQRHLLGIEGLNRLEILHLLDLAEEAVAVSRQVREAQGDAGTGAR